MLDSFAVFAKIIRYVIIFLKIIFKDGFLKIPIEGASDFKATNNNFLQQFFA